MTDFEAQLKKLYEESDKFLGDHKASPMADGPEKDALGQKITSSSLLASINTPYAEMLLPKIRDSHLPINERVGFVARLTSQILSEISGEKQYQRLLDEGMSPEEIERLSLEIARGEY